LKMARHIEQEPAPSLVGVHSADAFLALLRHERARSDREGNLFSVAVFNVSGDHVDGRGVASTARCIQARMRTIDELGWMPERKLGVLLPSTCTEGGRKFARRVCSALPEQFATLPWDVYSYPGDWLDPEPGKPGRAAAKNAGGVTGDLFARAFCPTVPGWKRYADVAGSLLFLLLTSPIFLLVPLYIKLVSPGPVFFRQRRVGCGGRTFEFLKFRTMRVNNDTSAHEEYLRSLIRDGKPMVKLDARKDSRIIPGARLLRKACIDELPQLINVLRGDMSLVGPRPCIPYEAAEYLRWHTHRFDIRPGMTGLWQVSGKEKLSFEQMIRLDIAYARRMSPLLDFVILLRTAPAIAAMVFDAALGKVRRRAHRGEAEGAMTNA
jgi:lipopolysaccharide/colanic/teichoic acid biosynthesis glycosyltransferase